jgi:hypothetical protein
MKKLWMFEVRNFSINRKILKHYFHFPEIPENSGKALRPGRATPDPTRSENHPPATHRRRRPPRPTRRHHADVDPASSFADSNRRSPIGLARFRVKPRRSDLVIPATSGDEPRRVLLLSSRSIDPWWWFASTWPVHGGFETLTFWTRRLLRYIPTSSGPIWTLS